jgi:hypothetical protein
MKRIFVLLIMVIFFQTSGYPNILGLTNKSVTKSCLSPIVGSKYPILYKDHPEEYPPQSPWKLVSKIPEIPVKMDVTHSTFKVFLPEGTDQIWVMGSYSTKENNGDKAFLWIYSKSSKEWKFAQSALNEFYYSIYRLQIYNFSDGSVYASQQNGPVFGQNLPNIVAKYSVELGKFIPLKFNQPFPEGSILFDKENQQFWGISSNGSIYKIDPRKLTIDLFAQSTNLGELSSIFPQVMDRNIYGISDINANSDEWNYKPNVIMKYDLLTKREEKITNPIKGDDYYSSVFLDRAGNLWLNDHSMMTKNGQWYQIQRSPIFITDRIKEMNDQYVWGQPDIVLESSNGYLWFNSINGISWYDPGNEEWCWVTNADASNPVEDTGYSIWMVVDKKLYSFNEK